VVFDAEGITAVVGPNGCGKSNLSEAISWVIGEQRARALRGGKMEDVIFQGSGNRSASGMAEVLLTMVVRESFEVRSDGSDVLLPEESPQPSSEPDAGEGDPVKRRRKAPVQTARLYEEGEQITVGRRLYRTGESEYEMNGRTCRLRDVQDLFSGTGLGGAHYAIIEQGRIGQVLSAKPLDRRAPH
jgi:chromosome segregation protein